MTSTVNAVRPQITFHSEVTDPDRRRVAEQSVAVLAARSAESCAAARAAAAADDALDAAAAAPVRALVEQDPAAAAALAEIAGKDAVADVDALYGQPQPVPGQDAGPISPLAFAASVGQWRSPPFDFSWSWHNTGGHAPFGQRLDNATGYVGLDARSGSVTGGASGFVEAHAGFGLVLRTDHPVAMQGFSTIHMRYFYTLACRGIGGNATVEGHIEYTVLENGRLIASTDNRTFRKRVSGNESSSFGEPDGMRQPDAVRWTMQPGREYTFNVGTWVFTDRSTGAGAAAAQALVEGTMFYLVAVQT